MHASIPTTYRGVRFRSRLEAKWAWIFDRIGWQWDYEPIDLKGWIPDFVIPETPQVIGTTNKPALVEIKPILQRDEQLFADLKRKAGVDWSDKYQLFVFGARLNHEWIRNDRVHLGWHYWANFAGWTELGFRDQTDFRQVWREATNAMQWKAPR